MARAALTVVALALASAACAREAPARAERPPPRGAAPGTPEAGDSEMLATTSEKLRSLLPRPLTPTDVEDVLAVAPVVDAHDEVATARALEERGLRERDWMAVRARVSLAYAWLLQHESASASPSAPQLRADVAVVRPFRARLDPRMRPSAK
jgi:hypothetical protein